MNDKEKYIPVELEVIEFDAEDAITTSNPNKNGGTYELPRI